VGTNAKPVNQVNTEVVVRNAGPLYTAALLIPVFFEPCIA